MNEYYDMMSPDVTRKNAIPWRITKFIFRFTSISLLLWCSRILGGNNNVDS